MEKQAKKEAKALAKEGWKVPSGELPIEEQLLKAYTMSQMLDDYGLPLYVKGNATAGGDTYDAAEFAASNLAKINIAGALETSVTEMIDVKRVNQQISAQEASSLTEVAGVSKAMVAQRIMRPIVVVHMRREKKKGLCEVQIMMFYNQELAMEALTQAMRDNLSNDPELAGKLDEILNRK
ncbi:MAG: hypothetical protein J6P73_03630 [Bacteroidales bacterium]|nr:hypothetical protein [Bacteroidales bacterium]